MIIFQFDLTIPLPFINILAASWQIFFGYIFFFTF